MLWGWCVRKRPGNELAWSPSCIWAGFLQIWKPRYSNYIFLFSVENCVYFLLTKMGIARQAYNTLFRRSSTFMVTIFVGAFVFERVFDDGMDRLWERINQGVSYTLFVALRTKIMRALSKTISVHSTWLCIISIKTKQRYIALQNRSFLLQL